MITHEEAKKATIHQQARTDLLNFYGKYMNKQMYAELWNYTLKVEERAKKVEELLGLYKERSTFVFMPDCNYKDMSIKSLDFKIKQLEEKMK
jgi:hypothetical protein